MKRLIEQLTATAARPLLKKYQESDSGRAAFAAFCAKFVNDSAESNAQPKWKFPLQWGTTRAQAPLLEPLTDWKRMTQQPETFAPAEWERLLLDNLVPLIQDAAGCSPYVNPGEYVLYGAELAIELGALLARTGWKPAAELLKQGKAALTESLNLFLDERGNPQVAILPSFRLLMASWTRLLYRDRAMPKLKLFTENEHLLYEWAIRSLLLLTNADGTQKGADQSQLDNPEIDIEFFKAVLALDEDVDDHNQAALALPWTSKTKVAAAKECALTEPCQMSDWAQTAILKSSWSCASANVLLTWNGPTMNLEFEAGGRRLIEGPWKTNVTVAGKKAKPAGEWEQICYACENDYAYLELELPLEGNVRLGRTVALLHEDDLLLLADTVKLPQTDCQAGQGAGCETCEYRSGCTLQDLPSCAILDRTVVKLPPVPKAEPEKQNKRKETKGARLTAQAVFQLCPGVSFAGASRSAEGWIQAGRTQRTVFPLALGEWRSQNSEGALRENRGQELVYQTSGRGVGLFSPLVIDLNPRRSGNAFTWRQLTITQKGYTLRPDAAAAFRLLIGEDQWLFYQSLCPPAPRAVLGHHLINQTYLGRFIEGQCVPIVEIE